jgi:hypothetical protein
LFAAAALAIAFGLAAPAFADDGAPPMPLVPGTPGSDTIVILVSDTNFGPDMEDANIAARFYCTTRGKLTAMVSKERPPEMRTQVYNQWSVLTYRCISAVTGDASAPK